MSLQRSYMPRKPYQWKRVPMKRAGRRTNEWRTVWRWLKPQLEAKGRTFCEFDFIAHECFGRLDPCHSKKRRMMVGSDIYMVAIGCAQVHRILDEVYSHAEMEAAVLKAINAGGGPILPGKPVAVEVKPVIRSRAINCLLQRNPFSGFVGSHGEACCRCEKTEATHHVWIEFWCGNTCKACADSIAKTHSTAEVEREGFIPAAA